MKIIIDENMPYAREAFSTLGEVVSMAGRAITADDARDATVLAVRSMTQLKAPLLTGSSVRYVGTATIGTDHMDLPWLDSVGIRHCSAPGCNADSVADYVTATLLHVAERRGVTLEGKTLGVVGCGNVGSRVVRRGQALGMRVLENDPPLARQTGDPRYRPLEALFEADYITFHTPLTRQGEDATWHLADAAFFARMRPNAVFMNAGRGSVADGAALLTVLEQKRIAGAALDVWEGEPKISVELAQRVFIATPHIAGHSFDGKVNGTVQVYRQIAEWLGVEPTWTTEGLLPPPDVPRLELDAAGRPDEDVLREAVQAVYPIQRDDAALRQSLELPSEAERAAAFDRLRKDYPYRREFSGTTVALKNASPQLIEKFRGLTFRVE
jgi:erythronate-4-phosphate dehydrogenase